MTLLDFLSRRPYDIGREMVLLSVSTSAIVGQHYNLPKYPIDHRFPINPMPSKGGHPCEVVALQSLVVGVQRTCPSKNDSGKIPLCAF